MSRRFLIVGSTGVWLAFAWMQPAFAQQSASRQPAVQQRAARELPVQQRPAREQPVQWLALLRGQTMGSTWSATVGVPATADLDTLRDGLQAQLDTVDQQMSTWKPDSDLNRFNHAKAGSWNVLAAPLYTVLSHALSVARASGGAYDPTVGPLVDLWGFGPKARPHRPPDQAAIKQARAHVGWWRIRLDPQRHRAWQPGGVHVDLSAIAKGFGVDQAARWLLAHGVDDFLVEVGGELRAHGHKPDGQPWRVAVERADAAAGAVQHAGQTTRVLTLGDQAVATSGDYRHYFEDANRTYSHHIDPRSGQPVAHVVASVTVVAPTCMEADPLGTTLSVLGPEAGMAWARQRGLAVLMIVRDTDGALRELMTPAFAKLLAP